MDQEIRDSIEFQAKNKAKVQPATLELEKLYDLRNAFRKALSKLSNNETKDVAMKELQKYVEENVTPQALRIFLSALTEQNKPIGISGKEYQVLLLGFIASVFKYELLDALDKPPNLTKTIIRITEAIYRNLTENATCIHNACAMSLVKLFEFCTPVIENECINMVYYAPLEAIISGGANKIAQTGAAHCIFELFSYMKEKNHLDLLTYFAPKFLSLFIVFFLVLFI